MCIHSSTCLVITDSKAGGKEALCKPPAATAALARSDWWQLCNGALAIHAWAATGPDPRSPPAASRASRACPPRWHRPPTAYARSVLPPHSAAAALQYGAGGFERQPRTCASEVAQCMAFQVGGGSRACRGRVTTLRYEGATYAHTYPHAARACGHNAHIHGRCVGPISTATTATCRPVCARCD